MEKPPAMEGENSCYLIINADDYGYSRERDEGIVACFRRGAITNASLMVNAVNSQVAAEWAKKEKLPVGLHLNLTEGLPVRANHGRSYSTLTDPEGRFWGKFGLREKMAAGSIDLNEDTDSKSAICVETNYCTFMAENVREETVHQIDMFEQLLGYVPSHVDGHQHIHVYPGICEVFAEVLRHKGIQTTRLPREKCISDCGWINSDKKKFFEEVVTQAINCEKVFAKNGLRFTSTFTGLLTCGENMTVERLQALIDLAFTTEKINLEYQGSSTDTAQPIRSCELMVHPGNCTGSYGGCGVGPDSFSQAKGREHEMKVLLSNEFRRYLKDNSIALSSFDCI